MILKPSLSFAGPREYRWQGLEVPALLRKRRGTAQIATPSPAGCAASNRHKNLLFSLIVLVQAIVAQRRRQQAAQPAIDTKTCSFRNSIARCVHQIKHASTMYL